MATTSTPLHKVKEEAKEYFGYQQSSEASSLTTTATTTMTTPTTTTTATTKTTTATTTTTTSMTTTTTTVTTTATTSTSLATVANIVTAPNSSTIVNGTGGVVPSVATTPPTTTTVPNASSPATTSTLHQSTGVVCHLSVPASSVLVNADPFPVDLDLKTKIKGACFLFSSFDRSNLWRWSVSKRHLTTRPPRAPDGQPRWMSERKK